MKKYEFSPPSTKNALERKRRKFEERLERGVQVLAAATGGPDTARLLAHWDTLMAEYDEILAQLEAQR